MTGLLREAAPAPLLADAVGDALLDDCPPAQAETVRRLMTALAARVREPAPLGGDPEGAATPVGGAPEGAAG